MRRLSLSLLVALVLLALVVTEPLARSAPPAEKPAAPTEISCLTVEGLGPDFVLPLARPIPANSPKEVREALLRHGQEMQLFGSDVEKLKGAKLVVAALDSEIVVTYGRMCYVWLARCAPECTGNGCAVIRVPMPKD